MRPTARHPYRPVRIPPLLGRMIFNDHGSLGDITFYASASHADVVFYEARAYLDGSSDTVIDTLNLGKPTPDATSTCTYHAYDWLSSLTPGNYEVAVASIGSSGEPGNESDLSSPFTVPLT